MRDALQAPESVVLIDPVASRMRATLYGVVIAPRIDAVEVAVIDTELVPKMRAKYIFTVAVSFTWIALAFAGATQAIPCAESAERQPSEVVMVTLANPLLAFKFPFTALYVVAAVDDELPGRLCAPASAAASVADCKTR